MRHVDVMILVRDATHVKELDENRGESTSGWRRPAEPE
jgi:hypothetical protein